MRTLVRLIVTTAIVATLGATASPAPSATLPGHLVVVRDAGGKGRHLYRLDLASGKWETLTGARGSIEAAPVVSKDGNRLLYACRQGSREWGVFLWDPQGNRGTRLTSDAFDAWPSAWLDDGSFVINTRAHLSICDAQGNVVRALSKARTGGSREVAVSAGGQVLYYTFDRSDDCTIMTYDLAADRTTPFQAHGICPTISPDGRWFAYCTSRQKASEIHVRDLTTGKTVTRKGFSNSLAFSPDSRFLAYTDVSSIHILTVDLKPVKRITVQDLQEIAWMN